MTLISKSFNKVYKRVTRIAYKIYKRNKKALLKGLFYYDLKENFIGNCIFTPTGLPF
ncbi:MAG: hypothetical protein Kow0079_05700 [Vicingaceae bacterium]